MTPTGICDRTQQVQDAILGALSDVDRLHGGDRRPNLAGLTDLASQLDGAGPRPSLKAGDFAGLTSLPYLLNLRQQQLDYAALTDVFSDLTALLGIHLSGNDLSSLDAGCSPGLTSLRTLNLDENALNTLEAGVFSDLTAI